MPQRLRPIEECLYPCVDEQFMSEPCTPEERSECARYSPIQTRLNVEPVSMRPRPDSVPNKLPFTNQTKEKT
jgi:hypothetical protein